MIGFQFLVCWIRIEPGSVLESSIAFQRIGAVTGFNRAARVLRIIIAPLM